MIFAIKPVNFNCYQQKHRISSQKIQIMEKNFMQSINFKGDADKTMQIASKIIRKNKASNKFDSLINEFTQIPQVSAIAIGGSKTTGKNDKFSDTDIEIYTDGDIPVQDRMKIIQKYSSKYDIGQDYFGPCDEFYVNDLGQFDIAYFDKHWMDDVIENVWGKHQPSNGYTTCFLHTIKNSRLLYDKDGWLQSKKEQLNTPYPKELKENIINRNMQLLRDKPFDSYSRQIKKAIERKDYNSLNHRLAAFMASYFDIIFAMNEVLHPGEKRLVRFAKDNCRILPNDFEENINALMINPTSNTLVILDDMIRELNKSLNNCR